MPAVANASPFHILIPAVCMSMLELAILFFVIALIAGVLGAGGVAGLSMSIAKWLVLAFLVLAVLSLLL